jgi:hypothetical protein
MDDTERVEDKASSNGYPIATEEAQRGVELDIRSTTTSSSNTRPFTPSYTLSNASDLRQQSPTAIDTSANSQPLLLSPNAAIGPASVYMPNVDLLHIGAQFSLDSVEDYGHVDIGGEDDLDVARATSERRGAAS